jgi:hypothetical protein
VTDKLDRVREYVERMAPIVRAAIYEGPDKQNYNNGYDFAKFEAQQDLLEILNEQE